MSVAPYAHCQSNSLETKLAVRPVNVIVETVPISGLAQRVGSAAMKLTHTLSRQSSRADTLSAQTLLLGGGYGLAWVGLGHSA